MFPNRFRTALALVFRSTLSAKNLSGCGFEAIRSAASIASLALLTFSSPIAHAEVKEGTPFYLEVGEQRILPYEHLEKYSVSGSDVVRYLRLPGSDSILLKGLKPGLATLYTSTSPTDSETHLIRIVAKKTTSVPGALLQALNSIRSLEVVDTGERYAIRGRILNTSDARALANLKQRFAAFIVDETTRSESEISKSLLALKPIMSAHPHLNVQSKDGLIIVSGGAGNVAQKDAITRQILAVDPLAVVDLQSISNNDPTLYFKVYLLEVKKELITELGVEWPTKHPARISIGTGSLMFGDSIDLTIHALSEQNLLRVLSSPELVVKAPGQAELFAGGELPIRQRSVYNDNIIWKSVGLSLKLDVKEYSGEQVRLTVETEMSHLDGSLKNDNIPGVQTNRIKTLVDGTIGKPLLMSGLLQEDSRSSTAGIPGLSSLPVLGKLFSSEDYQNSRSEFVAILLPERNLPTHPMQRISSSLPKGYLPLSRNYLSGEEKEEIQNSPNYPWNAL